MAKKMITGMAAYFTSTFAFAEDKLAGLGDSLTEVNDSLVNLFDGPLGITIGLIALIFLALPFCTNKVSMQHVLMFVGVLIVIAFGTNVVLGVLG